MLRLLATFSVLTLALSAAAVAQTAPSAPALAERAATMAIRGAYQSIADAQARGASTYLDGAKTHYRDALARLARHDAGAASAAMAASALARASIAEHPVPAPRDIPAPPALPAMAAGGMPPMLPHPQVAQMQTHRPPMMMMHHRGPGGMSGRFDATRLAADVKLANTAEARDLAQKALDADIARTHAAFSGNAQEAMRQGRVASALAMAVRSIALADHPRTFTQPQRRRPETATVGSLPAVESADPNAE